MDALISSLIGQGGPAAIIAVLLGVVAKLWLDGKAKDTQLISTLTDWREDTKLSNEKLFQALETLKAVIASGGRTK